MPLLGPRVNGFPTKEKSRFSEEAACLGERLLQESDLSEESQSEDWEKGQKEGHTRFLILGCLDFRRLAACAPGNAVRGDLFVFHIYFLMITPV